MKYVYALGAILVALVGYTLHNMYVVSPETEEAVVVASDSLSVLLDSVVVDTMLSDSILIYTDTLAVDTIN